MGLRPLSSMASWLFIHDHPWIMDIFPWPWKDSWHDEPMNHGWKFSLSGQPITNPEITDSRLKNVKKSERTHVKESGRNGDYFFKSFFVFKKFLEALISWVLTSVWSIFRSPLNVFFCSRLFSWREEKIAAVRRFEKPQNSVIENVKMVKEKVITENKTSLLQ